MSLKIRTAGVIGAAALLLPSLSFAQGAGAAGALPDARAVLKRYVDVTGVAKLTSLPGIHMRGTFEVPAGGLSGTMEQFVDKSWRTLQVTVISGIGEMRQGSDSMFAWTVDPVQGPRLLEGREFAERREQEDPRGMRRDPSYVVNAQTLERSVVDGEACVKLKLTWKSGRETTECYSEKTGLLVSMDGTETTSMGPIPSSTSFAEYKTFDGIMFATKVTQRAQGIEAIQRVTEVVFETVDPSALALPPAIQALRKR